TRTGPPAGGRLGSSSGLRSSGSAQPLPDPQREHPQQRCVPAEPGIVPTVEGRGEPFRLHRGVAGLLPAGAAAALALPAHGAPVRAEGGTVAEDPASQRRHARPCDGSGPPSARFPPAPELPGGPEEPPVPSPAAASASSAVSG